jgi:hypothetical protein
VTARVTQMGWATRTPCGSCPYRKDAPIALWHREEYESVFRSETTTDPLDGTIYGCHATLRKEPQVCAGWLLDQQRRGVPSIRLRLALMRNDAAVAALEAVNDGGHQMYDSALEMCAANGVKGTEQ